MKNSKFKISFEIDAIPYNKDTHHLLGDYFNEDWDSAVYAREDIGEILRRARIEFCMSHIRMMKGQTPEILKELENHHNRFDEILDQIESNIKIEEIG